MLKKNVAVWNLAFLKEEMLDSTQEIKIKSLNMDIIS